MTYKHETRRPETVWILVADRSRAPLFAGEGAELQDFREVESFVHPESAAHQRDVESDGPGRFCESQGSRHAAESKTDFKRRTANEFARELVRRIEHGREMNTLGRLVLVAPPLFLGVLRESLPGPLASLVIADLDQDLTHAEHCVIEAEARRLVQPSAVQQSTP